MAEEYEKNPATRFDGIPEHVVGAKAGLYLNNPMYEVAKLQHLGLMRKLANGKIILTQDGYNYIRPPLRRALHILGEHPLVIISIIVTIIGIIVGVITILK
jgi:hypothetical protein